MNTILWICQILLCLVFFYSGITKGLMPEPKLVQMGQTGIKGLSEMFIHFIGITELLGSAGIILPWLLHTAPVLTPVTSVCFAFVMVFATAIHYRHRNYFQVATHILIFGMALFVAI